MAKARPPRRRPPRPPPPRRGRIFLRQWREYRDLTQQEVAAAVRASVGGVGPLGRTSHPTIGRIELGKSPYTQDLLERIAEALQTKPEDLIGRHPADPEGIWSVLEQADSDTRLQIAEVAKTIIKTRAKK